MLILKNKKRLPLLLILCGIMASIAPVLAIADAASDYDIHCVRCHGMKAPGSISVNSFPTHSELAGYIDVYMPRDNPSACTGTCAQRMADYLKAALGNQPPVAKATGFSFVGTVPLKTYFNGRDSTDDNGIVSYTWSFGDRTTGVGDVVRGGEIDHTYTAVGTYPVTLTVVDTQGLKSSSSMKVYAVKTHTPPTINTSRTSALSGVSPLTVTFDASLSTCMGECRDILWTIDGGTSISSAVTSHTFNTVGTHTVNLSVYDGGRSDIDPLSVRTTTLTVTVTKSSTAPVADASLSANLKGAVSLTAQLDASKSNCANSCGTYDWNFGDNKTESSTFDRTSHVYSKAGDYTATLTVTDKSNGKKHTTSVPVKVVPAESLTNYVQACQAQLGFQNINIPDMNCYDGDLFATSKDFNKNARVNDFVGYKKITDQVDLTFACRWLFGNKISDPRAPASIEMLLHNRQSGNTCFFSAKGQVSGDPSLTSANIVSPTGPNATAFWDAPASVDANVRCVGCHVSGPYIATPTIAPFLAKYGLLNNGHDTLSNVSNDDLATLNKNVKYHAISGAVNSVPGAFSQWDSLKQSYINANDSQCSMGCHLLGTSSPQGDMSLFVTLLTNPASELREIHHADVMKPYYDGSDYRWINLDTPGDGVEKETFDGAINATTTLVPKLFSTENENCAQPAVPNLLEAHVVGSDNTFLVAQPGRITSLPDRLSVFNLKQGLVCLNSDQEPGQKCQDYRVSYECTDTTGAKSWVTSTDHVLRSDGDHEERPASVCPSTATATAIKAQFTEKVSGWTYGSNGPNDRLASFSPYGLTCNNADQPDGQCSNYVVRYSSCNAPPATVSRTLTNVFAAGKELTAASGSLTKGQAHNSSWNTQLWDIDPVKNTEYVRLHLTGLNVYLNVSSQAESATVGTAALNTSTSEMWLIEPVSGSTDVRLKNVYSGKYLTMADPASFPSTPDYLPIFSQTRNTSWTSQRWVVR